MLDAYTVDDAEMADDDEYDYEMQEEPAPSGSGAAPLQEYDMAREDQADYEDVIVAEPIAATPTADVPIFEETETVPLEENMQPPQPEIPETSPVIAQSVHPVRSTDAPLATDTSIAAPESVITLPTEPLREVPMSSQTDASAAPATSPIIQLPDLPGDTTVATLPTESLSATAPSPSIETHVAVQHDVPSQDESTLPAEPHAATPTFTVPSIAFYFEDKVFSLFQSNETGSSVLLAGRQDLYTSPLARLLREIKVQEHALFPGIEDCVLGLEYPELDLCIDQVRSSIPSELMSQMSY